MQILLHLKYIRGSLSMSNLWCWCLVTVRNSWFLYWLLVLMEAFCLCMCSAAVQATADLDKQLKMEKKNKIKVERGEEVFVIKSVLLF